MDTSKGYTKMCDCFEIQGEWKQRNGDYIFGELSGDVYILCFAIRGQLNKSWSRWLPRQDQIQEMLWRKFHNPIKKMQEFVRFMEKWLWLDFKTVEQQLLAFYMFENHQKIWNGEQWVKSVKE